MLPNNRRLNRVYATKCYKKINETSRYPTHLLCIDQDFTTKYVAVYLILKEFGLPVDILRYIFWLLYVVKGMLDVEFDNEKDVFDLYLSRWYDGYKNYLLNNKHILKDQIELTCKTRTECLRCKTVVGSKYCEAHMNCDLCGFNMRFEKCVHNK